MQFQTKQQFAAKPGIGIGRVSTYVHKGLTNAAQQRRYMHVITGASLCRQRVSGSLEAAVRLPSSPHHQAAIVNNESTKR